MRFFSCLALSFLLVLTLRADWNKEFDSESNALMQKVATLQNQTYFQQYVFFYDMREKILANQELRRKVKHEESGNKLIYFDKQNKLVIKKRRNNHIHELFAWELSFLLGSSEFVAPSFPMEIAGKRVIVQRQEPFEIGSGNLSRPRDATLALVTLETYWKAHLQAFLLGLGDLAGQNIGVSPEGVIRFFDNEASFIYHNEPFKTDDSFSMGFICQSFDWPHYRMPLDRKTAESLRNYIGSLDGLEENLKIYSLCRQFPFPNEGFLSRLQKVRNFAYREGATFRDFFGTVFPQISPGLDDLTETVGQFLGYKIDHGTMLFFICRHMKKQDVPLRTKSVIKNWVDKYVK